MLRVTTEWMERLRKEAAELIRRGRMAEARNLLEQILAANPQDGRALERLGALALAEGNYAEAAALLKQAAALEPEMAGAHDNLGIALVQLDEHDAAIKAFERSLQLDPNSAATQRNLGNLLRCVGRNAEAVKAFERSVALDGGTTEGFLSLGRALKSVGVFERAKKMLEKAIALDGSSAAAHDAMGSLLVETGRIADGIAAYRRSLEIGAGSGTQDRLLYALQLDETATPEEIFEEHRRWGRERGGAQAEPHQNAAEVERVLRIGYVSPDFREHPVAHFLAGLLAHHDRERFEIFCYATSANRDEWTRRFETLATGWRNAAGMSARNLAEMIRGDRIDLLVDLAGHTGGNALETFALRPAPVQMTWLGYPDTTGLPAMDYRVTDGKADPVGESEKLHVEKLLRLPETFLCYEAPAGLGEITVLPAVKRGCVTFGCFHARKKISGPMIRVWAKILRETPGSKLLLKGAGLEDELVRRELLREFEKMGIEAGRITMHGRMENIQEHYRFYGAADVALDTHPYNGTSTTCEALYAGLPVVSLAGKRHASRVGASILGSLGLGGLVARSEEEYAEIAKKLAGDLGKLSELRQTLRGRMKNSVLMDAQRFAREMEAAYRRVWGEWVRKQAKS